MNLICNVDTKFYSRNKNSLKMHNEFIGIKKFFIFSSFINTYPKFFFDNTDKNTNLKQFEYFVIRGE